ncbi:hypothetical protein [Phenylobacterium sp.]|uniref:hypothetical protein n=1 Tax=Phenylobacterium sp. TaxID=1871053 RepID=UPI00273754A5|nr:hypothetical protein [Phenylobacterium sp.]MDP3659606.1 hypothetical protein [Phenylobacterium sp.]
MRPHRSLWRDLRGLFAALLLAVLVGGAALDGVQCAAEGVVTQDQSAAIVIDGEAGHAEAGHPCEGAGVCGHGHSHQSPTPSLVAGVAPPAGVFAEATANLATQRLASGRIPGLPERPPKVSLAHDA